MLLTQIEHFNPLIALRTKLILYVLTISLTIWSVFNIIFRLKSEESALIKNKQFALLYSTSFIVMLIVLAIYFINLYYQSVIYEIVENEVHVNRGIITKTRKIIPYRTITNVEIKQGPYDRLLKIGTIELQTAGSSRNNSGPEERLDGLPAEELAQIQEQILIQIRNMRGTPGLSQDSDIEDTNNPLLSILNEIKELKKFLLNKPK